jgi:hypothetical protein
VGSLTALRVDPDSRSPYAALNAEVSIPRILSIALITRASNIHGRRPAASPSGLAERPATTSRTDPLEDRNIEPGGVLRLIIEPQERAGRLPWHRSSSAPDPSRRASVSDGTRDGPRVPWRKEESTDRGFDERLQHAARIVVAIVLTTGAVSVRGLPSRADSRTCGSHRAGRARGRCAAAPTPVRGRHIGCRAAHHPSARRPRSPRSCWHPSWRHSLPEAMPCDIDRKSRSATDPCDHRLLSAEPLRRDPWCSGRNTLHLDHLGENRSLHAHDRHRSK